MGISTVVDPNDAICEFAVYSLLFSHLWFRKRMKKPPDLLLSCHLVPLFPDLTLCLLVGHLDGTKSLDEMILGLPAWFFATRPWKICSMSFEMPFGCFLFGSQVLELLQT